MSMKNLSLADALRRCRWAGAEVTVPRRTGEFLVVGRAGRVRGKLGRKDAPRALLTLLRRLEKEPS